MFPNREHWLVAWWRHQMENFTALLAICAGNSPVTGEFAAQRSVAQSFDVFFNLRLNKRLTKQSWGWWFETLSRPLWRPRNVTPRTEYDDKYMNEMVKILRKTNTHGNNIAIDDET